MQKRKMVTIRDVASRAGVSYQTVSRVLNNKELVNKNTREKVIQVIDELGYRPDPIATSLATRRSYVLGLLTATFTGNAIVQIIEGADRYAIQHGYQFVISGEEHKSGSEPQNITFTNRQRIEGYFILYHGAKSDHYKILKEIPVTIPVVTTGYGFDQPNILSIRVDSKKGAYDAVMHLLKFGHTKIAMITGTKGAYETVERISGYETALHEAGIRIDNRLIEYGDWFVDSGYNGMKKLLHRGAAFSAVFTHSDRMAIGCIAALEEHRLKVPKDIAVIGYNDIPLSKYVLPALTTVRYPFLELGRICAKLLIKKTNGINHPENEITQEEKRSLETKLIVRKSCGAYEKTVLERFLG